jgi:DNA polymerase-4
MNSYFATVEQQANPKLRGKPVAVLGSHAKRTIIVAASVEAKKFGIKTGTRVEDAPKLCPSIIFVHGEQRKYSFVTKKFIEIFESYTDRVEIFSIDEAFLDVTQTEKLYGGAENIAKEIKHRIRQEIGEYISCSIGISTNKFLAKVGSNLQKPDGLVIITPENRDEILLNLPLSKFCGIGRRTFQRLGAIGIYTTDDLRTISNIILNREFGITTGEKLKRMAYGLDNAPVTSWHDRADAKSFSHSRTLNKDVTNQEEIKKHILLLSEKVARHMRKDGYLGREVGLWLRFKDFSGASKSQKMGKWTHDGVEIAEEAQKILKTLNLPRPVRAIGVYVGNVQRGKNIPASLLPEDVINDKILLAMDTVNDRFGEDVVTRARLTGTKIKEIVSGMGRDKF